MELSREITNLTKCQGILWMNMNLYYKWILRPCEPPQALQKTSHSSDNKFPFSISGFNHMSIVAPKVLNTHLLSLMHMSNRGPRPKVQALSSTVWLSTKPQSSLCLSEPSSPEAFYFCIEETQEGEKTGSGDMATLQAAHLLSDAFTVLRIARVRKGRA